MKSARTVFDSLTVNYSQQQTLHYTKKRNLRLKESSEVKRRLCNPVTSKYFESNSRLPSLKKALYDQIN